MAKADFIHKIKQSQGRNILAITDLDLGGMSVTNNMEEVVHDIEIMENIDADEYMIIYKDSNSTWDGWDKKTGRFIPLNEQNWWDAVSKYVQLQLENKIS